MAIQCSGIRTTNVFSNQNNGSKNSKRNVYIQRSIFMVSTHKHSTCTHTHTLSHVTISSQLNTNSRMMQKNEGEKISQYQWYINAKIIIFNNMKAALSNGFFFFFIILLLIFLLVQPYVEIIPATYLIISDFVLIV